MDLAGGRVRVVRSKTAAGEREVDLLPFLREVLIELKVRRSVERDALVFGTTTGRKESASNVRNRLLRKAVARANAALIGGGKDGLPDRLTPHSLPHTFASLLVALGEDPGYVMDQMGHTDPSFTLRVYRKAMKRRDGEPDLFRALVGGGATTLVDLEHVRRNGQSKGNNGGPLEQAEGGERVT